MNIRILTGFLTGAAAILLFWCFLAPTADNELRKTVPVQVVPVAETGIQKNKEKPEQSLPPTAQQETTTEIPGKAAIISTISSKPPFPPAVEQETGVGIPNKTVIRTDSPEPLGNNEEHHQEEISKTEPEKELPDDQSKPPVPVPALSPENISRISATERSARNLTTQKQIFDSDPALNVAVDFVPTSPAGDKQNYEMPNSKKFFFWSPFSLNSKAEVFANYITSVSGVECGVEKTGAGRYQVYFPFEDESDRDEKSALIKGTGLKF